MKCRDLRDFMRTSLTVHGVAADCYSLLEFLERGQWAGGNP